MLPPPVNKCCMWKKINPQENHSEEKAVACSDKVRWFLWWLTSMSVQSKLPAISSSQPSRPSGTTRGASLWAVPGRGATWWAACWTWPSAPWWSASTGRHCSTTWARSWRPKTLTSETVRGGFLEDNDFKRRRTRRYNSSITNVACPCFFYMRNVWLAPDSFDTVDRISSGKVET